LLLTNIDLYRASDRTVRIVSNDVVAIGVSGRAAPGGSEASCIGAGVVDNSLVDKGELAGGGAGGGGGGCRGCGCCRSNWTGVGVTISIISNNMVPIDVSLCGTPGRIESSGVGTAGVGYSHVCKGKYALSSGCCGAY